MTRLPIKRILDDGLALASLEKQLLQPGTKGLLITARLRQGAPGLQGWKVLHGPTSRDHG
jgi:D-serine dehydratase